MTEHVLFNQPTQIMMCGGYHYVPKEGEITGQNLVLFMTPPQQARYTQPMGMRPGQQPKMMNMQQLMSESQNYNPNLGGFEGKFLYLIQYWGFELC